MSKEHVLYKDGDDIPESLHRVITDNNGQVALDVCKVCGKGEIDLDEDCEPKKGGAF